jgi:hypothetical protein
MSEFLVGTYLERVRLPFERVSAAISINPARAPLRAGIDGDPRIGHSRAKQLQRTAPWLD